MNLQLFKQQFINFISQIKSLFPFIISLYLGTLGLGWTCFYLYIYIFSKRPIYSLYDLEITNNILFIFSYFIFIHFMLICSCIWSLIVRRYSIVQKGHFKVILEKIHFITDAIIWNPLEYIHDKIAPHIPESGNFFCYLQAVWIEKKDIFFNIMILCVNILPRVLLASIFFIDVVIFAQVKYFVYGIYLALIPIGFTIFLKLFISFAERIKKDIRILEYKHVDKPLKEVPENVFTGDLIFFDLQQNVLKKTYYIVVTNPAYHYNQEHIEIFFDMERILSLGNRIKKKLAYMSPYTLIVTSSIYLIAGLYRLWIFLV